MPRKKKNVDTKNEKCFIETDFLFSIPDNIENKSQIYNQLANDIFGLCKRVNVGSMVVGKQIPQEFMFMDNWTQERPVQDNINVAYYRVGGLKFENLVIDVFVENDLEENAIIVNNKKGYICKEKDISKYLIITEPKE